MSDQDRPGGTTPGESGPGGTGPDDRWSAPLPQWPEEEPGSAPASMPQQLQRAVRLMVAAGLITLVTIPFIVGSRQGMREEAHAELGEQMTTAEIDSVVDAIVTLGVLFTAVVAGLWFLMAYLNNRGKAWARITSMVLGVLFVLVMLWYVAAVLIPAGAAVLTLPNLLSLLVLAIAVFVLSYLWSPPVRDWFDQQRGAGQ